jgi:tetratricopeptide (TPR) repeat protein
LLLPLAASFSQSSDNTARFNRALSLYADGYWGESIVEFRRYQQESPNATSRAEAQFWIAMVEIAAGEYIDAIHDFDEITRIDPLSIRRYEVPYQKARAYYYLGRYNEAIVLFSRYADSIRIDGRYLDGTRADNWHSQNGDNEEDYQKKASAIYWIGECLYNLDQYDKASEMYNVIIGQYSRSHKYESSTNRIALIKQKKIEEELLAIVRKSTQKQEEAAAQSATAQGALSQGAPSQGGGGSQGAPQQGSPFLGGKDATDAMLAYKNSIAPFLLRDASKDSYTPSQAQTPVQNEIPRPSRTPVNGDTTMRLLTIKTQALEMMERITSTLNAFETISQEGW